MRTTEILAPAGGCAALMAAVAAGAGAVYFGGKSFNARSQAENIGDDDLESAIDYCHERGVRTYITVNTLYRNDELRALACFVGKLYKFGADALIMQDMGAAMFVKEHFPDIELHASTQMTAHSAGDALFLANHGFSRIVLSRELPLSDIKDICKKLDGIAEIEVFVHGALCVSYSGQCLMSSFLGGRSGNRGECAQPCRLSYGLMKNSVEQESGYLLSTRDLCALPILDNVIDAGVASIKIEGRMKSPEYVYAAVRAYRERLDRGAVSDASFAAVNQVFNRGGKFTEGYFKNYSGGDMMSFESPKPQGALFGRVLRYDNARGLCDIKTELDAVPGDGIYIKGRDSETGIYLNKVSKAGERIQIRLQNAVNTGDTVYKSFDKALMDGLKRDLEKDTKKLPVNAVVTLKKGEKAKLSMTVSALGKRVTSEAESADICETAQKSPVDEKRVAEQVKKLGGTTFAVDSLDVNIDENIFINMTHINEMRRTAADGLRQLFTAAFKRGIGSQPRLPELKTGKKAQKHVFSAKIASDRLDALISANERNGHLIKRVYIEYDRYVVQNIGNITKKCENADLKLYVALPHINRGELSKENVETLSECNGFLVRNYSSLELVKEVCPGKDIVLDYTFHISNTLSNNFYKTLANAGTLSRELSVWEMEDFADSFNEFIIYGVPLFMITNQCPVGNLSGKDANKFCRKKGNRDEHALIDRTGARLKLMTNCEQCLAYVYNDRPFFALNRRESTFSGYGGLRLEFTCETDAEISDVLSYAVAFESGKEKWPPEDYKLTYGHFFNKRS